MLLLHPRLTFRTASGKGVRRKPPGPKARGLTFTVHRKSPPPLLIQPLEHLLLAIPRPVPHHILDCLGPKPTTDCPTLPIRKVFYPQLETVRAGAPHATFSILFSPLSLACAPKFHSQSTDFLCSIDSPLSSSTSTTFSIYNYFLRCVFAPFSHPQIYKSTLSPTLTPGKIPTGC